MEHRELRSRFETGTLEPSDMTHANHVRLAWIYLKDMDVPETMIKMREGLRRFASDHGALDKYNETVTFAYITLIAQRKSDGGNDWHAFVKENPDLFERWTDLMARYYHQETLSSPQAKTRFLLPDRTIPIQRAS